MGIEKQVETWKAINMLLWDISKERDKMAQADMTKIYMEMVVFYEDTYKCKFFPNKKPQ